MVTHPQCQLTLLQWGPHREEQLKLTARSPRCPGYVGTRPCWSRLRGNVLCVWRSGPGSTHSCRSLWRGGPQTAVMTSIRSTISASRKAHLSSRAGAEATGPKRSVLPPIPLRKQCSGTQPSEITDTNETPPCHTSPYYPTPLSSGLSSSAPAHHIRRTSLLEHRGVMLMSKDNGGDHSNITVCSGFHHHW